MVAFSQGQYSIRIKKQWRCISDIVIQGELSPELQKSAELYAGCVSGALEQEKYLAHIRAAGFEAVEIKQSRPIDLPVESFKF